MDFETETDARLHLLEGQASSAERVARHATFAMVWVFCAQTIIYFFVDVSPDQKTFIMAAGAALVVVLFGVRFLMGMWSDKARREIEVFLRRERKG